MTSKNLWKEIPIVLTKIGSVIPKAKATWSHHWLSVRSECLRGYELLWAKMHLCWVAEAGLCLRSLTVACSSRDMWSQRLSGLLEAARSHRKSLSHCDFTVVVTLLTADKAFPIKYRR